ncbi:DOMON-like domain-containing protein [Calothrix sp. PCC 7507]|uniref:DOMON-like domain-containing protein n=1 Tax=Calothrix sp. PCC 7507 TaxID=99598 RepID=UPI00029F08D8|nr:DOMON-like domain-containing protein [Calothrix sp. PCC 7507]AFY35048.1 hypothetical protein Cal7507_4687 [Calothrix sp. PCC 7507]
MNEQTFSLQPFPFSPAEPDLKIVGSISRNANLLVINYLLLGDIKKVAIAPPSDTPARKHQLWANTCFEFFIGVKNSPQYWEFNLSPTGKWNVYRFDGYRQGMQEETAFAALPFSVQHFSDSLAIALNVNLAQIIPPENPVEVAITTVIKHTDGELTYWALTHPGTEADFHQRDSFTIEL